MERTYLGREGDINNNNNNNNSSGFLWPQRNYSCSFCKRQFNSAQALGGHMNVHRRDRAMLIQLPSWVFECPNPNNTNPSFSSSTSLSSSRQYCSRHSFHSPPLTASFSSQPPSFNQPEKKSMPEYDHRSSCDPLISTEDLTVKKNMRAFVEVEEFKNKGFANKYELEVLKKSEVISLELEIGCKDPKEVLDLELRLGCF